MYPFFYTLFETETIWLVHLAMCIMISIDTIPKQYFIDFLYVGISVVLGITVPPWKY